MGFIYPCVRTSETASRLFVDERPSCNWRPEYKLHELYTYSPTVISTLIFFSNGFRIFFVLFLLLLSFRHHHLLRYKFFSGRRKIIFTSASVFASSSLTLNQYLLFRPINPNIIFLSSLLPLIFVLYHKAITAQNYATA